MAPESFDAVSRSLARQRSRRVAVAVIVATTTGRLAMPQPASAKGCKYREDDKRILRYIRRAAKKYNQSKKAMERVARCESNLDPCAVNKKGPYYGLFQFLKSTWKSTPYGNEDIFDPKAQALAAAWMWKKGRKNEWACQ
jgi:soluble lytic murein transglycosylase-like protein